jgi:hypothetical protein
MRFPEYRDGSLVNLIASFTAARGGRPRHAPLAALPPGELAASRNLIYLLVDGLGYNYLTDVGRGGALVAHLAGQLTSVFPSTTASAVTASFTGLTPQEHGLTGWFTWFPEADVLAAPLPFRRRGDDRPLAELGIRTQQLFDVPNLFDELDARCVIVTPARIVDSDYSRHFGGRAERRGYEGLAGMVTEIEAAVLSGSERKYIHAYYADFDAVSHTHGVGSRQAAARLAAIDTAFADLLKRLTGTDTTIVVSADHGFIDTAAHEALDLAAYPELAALLRQPLSGEPRVAFCHVRAGCVDEFIVKAHAALDGRADVRPARELIVEGWFGPGVPHPRLTDRVGDVALVMRGHGTIRDHLPGEKRHVLIGNPGGATDDEMLIPLVLARL